MQARCVQYATLLLIFSTVGILGCQSSPKKDSTQSARSFRYKAVESEPQFTWPAEGTEMTDPFGKRRSRGRIHKGLDLASKHKSPIYAAAEGVVTWRGRGRGYGKYIKIRHKGGWTTRYAHLHRYRVSMGSRVKKGQLIGLMGRTGRASGTHLHFEIRHKGLALNPMDFLPRVTSKTSEGLKEIKVGPVVSPLWGKKQAIRPHYLSGPVVWLF